MADEDSTNTLTGEESLEFRARLLAWYSEAKRDLPWRRTRDPYAIWISEIMLQQTRVSAVIPYFEKFLARFPDFAALASAPEPDLLAHWAGLGYYYRARNLQKAAQAMAAAGAFPGVYAGIAELPGVGDYTAAAVASIAFGLPHAVVDGNVYRVLSRICNDSTNIASSQARKRFALQAEELLDREHPGEFNQAMMELGATICLPKRPQCLLCPVRSLCQAQKLGTQESLPIKIKPRTNAEEIRRVLIVQEGGKLLLWQLPPSARLMPGFWELPEAEHLPNAISERQVGTFRHGITVHNYKFEVWEARAEAEGVCRWVEESELAALPLSTVARKALRIVKPLVNRAASAAV